MKEYKVKYTLKPIVAEICVLAESEEEAQEEIERVFRGEAPQRDENFWIDQDTLWDVEWYTDVDDVVEIES